MSTSSISGAELLSRLEALSFALAKVRGQTRPVGLNTLAKQVFNNSALIARLRDGKDILPATWQRHRKKLEKLEVEAGLSTGAAS